MKKSMIMIATVAMLLSPIAATAFAPGYLDSRITCMLWRQGMPLEQDGNMPAGYCTGPQETSKRLYDLENAIQTLQSDNQRLGAQVATLQRTQTPVGRVGGAGATDGALESRVASLEGKMSGMQSFLTIVVEMLTQILNALKH